MQKDKKKKQTKIFRPNSIIYIELLCYGLEFT